MVEIEDFQVEQGHVDGDVAQTWINQVQIIKEKSNRI